MTLVLGSLLGQNVTFEGLTAFNGPTWTNAKALFSAALGLHFGHIHAPLLVLVRRLQTPCSLVGPEPLFFNRPPKWPVVLERPCGPSQTWIDQDSA